MDPERWRRVSQAFDELCDLPAEERPARLAQLERESPEVAVEVGAMLAADRTNRGAMADGALPFAAAATGVLTAGARLGPYEIVAPLGAGGMGKVYRARDTRLDRSVALKVISSLEAASPEQRERFRREARAIARLSHPNICTLHDVGEDNGVAFLVMEHLEGQTLAERMAEGPLPPAEAVGIAGEIAAALDRAHREGIVHRDLKPGNVILTRHGAKVLDFGLAKLREAAGAEHGESMATVSATLTEEGRLVGTLPYMSPEQLEGRSADARTDIFSLGIVLHEMVAGARPFQATSGAGLIAAILTAEPPRLGSLRPNIPQALERVVKRCLAKDPDERWQTARDLAAELRWIAEPGSETPAPMPAGPPRRRGTPIVWLTAGLAVAGALAWALVTLGPRVLQRPSPRWQSLSFRRGTVSSARFAPDGQTVVYSAAWDGGPYEVFSARVGSIEARPLGLREGRILGISPAGEMALIVGPQRFTTGLGTLVRVPVAGGAPRELLENVRAADWTSAGAELAVAQRTERRDRVEFPIGKKLHEAAFVWSVRVSPDGERVAFFAGPDQGGDLLVGDRSGKTTVLSRGWQVILGLAWSPRGDEVWFGASKGDIAPALYAVSLSGKERMMLQAPEALSLQDVSRDGRALVLSVKARGNLACLVPGEKEERELGWHDSSWVEDLSADGRTVLFTETQGGGAPNGAVYVRGTDGSPAVRLGDGHAEGLSPDGSRALAKTRRGPPQLMLLPTRAGSPRTLPAPGLESIVEADWIDDRRIVFSGRQSGKPQRVYVQDVDDGTIRPITPEGTFILHNAPTPDGRFVTAVTGGRAVLYPVDGGEPKAIPHLAPEDTPIQWSADSRHLFVSRGGPVPVEIQRIDVTTGTRTPWRTLAPRDPVGVERITPIVLTPDGRAHCYTYPRVLTDLFVVEGLR